MGTPVVKSINGYGLPVTVVASGGLTVSLAGNGIGTPIVEIAQGGLPVTFDQEGAYPPNPAPPSFSWGFAVNERNQIAYDNNQPSIDLVRPK
jgi:hypothetical protein